MRWNDEFCFLCLPKAQFLKALIINEPGKLFLFYIKNFAGNVIKLSVNKMKWTGFLDATCTFVL